MPADPAGLEEPQLTLLQQRRIEARVLKPVLEAFAAELGYERARQIAQGAIVGLARQTGAALAGQAADRSLRSFSAIADTWRKGGALEIDVVDTGEASGGETYGFNVTRCRFAEMYRDLGMESWGFTLSCNRDGSTVEGFNPDITLTRPNTIMQGAPCCDFRYRQAAKGD